MTDSNHSNSRPARAGEFPEDPARDVPADLQDLDQALDRMLSPLADDSPDGLSDRVFEASVQDLPTKVLPFGAATEAEPTRVRIPYLAYAALILVAVLAWVANMNRAVDAPTITGEFADASSTTTLATFEIEGPRESEAMLMAVLDPSEDWFEDDGVFFDDRFETGVGAVLQTRGFGLDDLSGDVLAMLGGSAS